MKMIDNKMHANETETFLHNSIFAESVENKSGNIADIDENADVVQEYTTDASERKVFVNGITIEKEFSSTGEYIKSRCTSVGNINKILDAKIKRRRNTKNK